MADGPDASNALTAGAIESCLGGCSSSYAGEFVIELATKELKFFSARALVRNAITKLAVGGGTTNGEKLDSENPSTLPLLDCFVKAAWEIGLLTSNAARYG